MQEKNLYPKGPLHGRVAHEMGRMIVSGVIAEGGFLPRETELSKQFSVSRQAVREGLKVLAAKGLVNSRRRAGTYVLPRKSWNIFDPDVLAWHPPADLQPDFFEDLAELRRTIEPTAAALAAARAAPAELIQIAEAMEGMRRTAASDTAAFLAADARFHLALLAASGNAFFVRMSTILGPLLEANFRMQMNVNPSLISALAMHEAVYEGIVARDPAKARAAMEKMVNFAIDQTASVVVEMKRLPGQAAE